MNDARTAFPVDLFEPYEFKGDKEERCVCQVLIVRTLETATVVFSHLPDSLNRSLADNIKRIANGLYVARLRDLPAWRVRWYARSPAHGGHLEAACAVILERVKNATSPDGAIGASWVPAKYWRCSGSSTTTSAVSEYRAPGISTYTYFASRGTW